MCPPFLTSKSHMPNMGMSSFGTDEKAKIAAMTNSAGNHRRNRLKNGRSRLACIFSTSQSAFYPETAKRRKYSQHEEKRTYRPESADLPCSARNRWSNGRL